MIKKLGLAILCVTSVFAMHNVELNVNDKDIEMGIKLDVGQFSDNTEPGTVFIGGKFLHGDETHSDLKKTYDYGELNFLMKREISNIGLSLGLGVKVNYTKDFTSVPLGVELEYKLPVGNQIPMHIGGYFYYAPSVLTMQDGENFLEFRLEFDAEVIKNAHIVAGYRNLDTNYDSSKGGNAHYNQAPYVGFRFAF